MELQIFWVEILESGEGSIVPYIPSEYREQARRFLSFNVEPFVVIVGAFLYHKDLFDACKGVSNAPVVSEEFLYAAGTCGHGTILCWESLNFSIMTNPKKRPFIREKLGMEDAPGVQ